MGRPKKSDDEKVRKPGVALDQECRAILSKIREYETSLRNDLGQSQTIRKCMRLAWDLHYKALFEKYAEESAQKKSSRASKVSRGVGAKTAMLSENLDIGCLKATTETSQRAI
jgi:hypothetical protein